MTFRTSNPPPSFSVSPQAEAVARALFPARLCLLVTHENPDGDGVGSMLALRLALTALGKNVDCAAPQPCPARYAFLPGAELLATAPAHAQYDCALALDCDGDARMGPLRAAFHAAPVTLNMDHHLGQDGFAQTNWTDATRAATGLLARELLAALGAPLTPDIAACLYCAVATDTGFFRFRNTSAEALSVAGELVAAGVDAGEMARRVSEEMPVCKTRLLGRALAEVQQWAGGQVAGAALSLTDFAAAGALAEHTDGVIDELRRIEGAQIVFLVREHAPGEWKVSLRSTQADVAAICRRAGGGGHRLAAGCELRGSQEEVVRHLVDEAAAALGAGPGP